VELIVGIQAAGDRLQDLCHFECTRRYGRYLGMRINYQVFPYVLDLPVYNIWILTSLDFGGATSTSSILRGSPAPQQTAALHLIVVPAVDDI
jgi:hypothetical protein